MSQSVPWGPSAVPKWAHYRVKSQPLRGRPQRGRLVKCGHLQTRGDVRKVELFIIPVCFAAALHGCYLTINCKLLFILFNVCHRIYWLALIGLQRSGFQGEVVYMNYLLILTLLWATTARPKQWRSLRFSVALQPRISDWVIALVIATDWQGAQNCSSFLWMCSTGTHQKSQWSISSI